jgi:S-adenosyl methyltransferase
VYADNDPIVLLHARALLASTPQGTCDYVEADLRDTAAIVRAAAQMAEMTKRVNARMSGPSRERRARPLSRPGAGWPGNGRGCGRGGLWSAVRWGVGLVGAEEG